MHGFNFLVHVIQINVTDGIWWYDITKRPGLHKQRNFARYPDAEQNVLNSALLNNVRSLTRTDPKSGTPASINLDFMEHLCGDCARTMKLTDRSANLICSWDSWFYEETKYEEEQKSFSESVYCEICEMWLNGPLQWEDHKIGKKHKENIKRQESVPSLNNNCEKDINDKGILIPKGTSFLIEQNAIYEDAVKTYLVTLYKRGIWRARL